MKRSALTLTLVAASAILASCASTPAAGPMSFFVTSSNPGKGGDLGGLAGADQICTTAATAVGFGHKTWRAFLSVYNNGTPLHAIDRIGTGPWYDANERLVAMDLAGLTSGDRPAGDAASVNDLPCLLYTSDAADE